MSILNKENFILNFGEAYRNSSSHTYDNHLEAVNQIDECFVKFSLLAHRLKFQQNEVKNVYLLSYLTSIANNFLVVKQLFVTGFHFQMEVLQRTQLEQLNNVLAAVNDDDFLKYFTKTWVRGSTEDFIPFSPKTTHVDKAINKINFKDPEKRKIFREMYYSMKETYEEFSKSAHGNLMHILLLTEENAAINDTKIVRLGGKVQYLPRSTNYLNAMLDYSEIIYFLLRDEFPETEDEDLFIKNIKILFSSNHVE